MSDPLRVGLAGLGHAGLSRLPAFKRNPGLTAEALQAYCRDKLTGYNRPNFITFTKEVPKSNVGKFLRRELREMYGAAEN